MVCNQDGMITVGWTPQYGLPNQTMVPCKLEGINFFSSMYNWKQLYRLHSCQVASTSDVANVFYSFPEFNFRF